MLPGRGDGDDAKAQQRNYPEKPARSLQAEEAGDGDGSDDVTAWNDADRIVVGDEDAVDLIEGTVGGHGPGHFGWIEIPDTANDEEGKGGRDEILVKIALMLKGERSQPRDDEHEEIGGGHERPEGDPSGHFDDGMFDVSSLVDHEVDHNQESTQSIQEEGSYDELFHDVMTAGLKKAQPYLVCAFDWEGG